MPRGGSHYVAIERYDPSQERQAKQPSALYKPPYRRAQKNEKKGQETVFPPIHNSHRTTCYTSLTTLSAALLGARRTSFSPTRPLLPPPPPPPPLPPRAAVVTRVGGTYTLLLPPPPAPKAPPLLRSSSKDGGDEANPGWLAITMRLLLRQPAPPPPPPPGEPNVYVPWLPLPLVLLLKEICRLRSGVNALGAAPFFFLTVRVLAFAVMTAFTETRATTDWFFAGREARKTKGRQGQSDNERK